MNLITACFNIVMVAGFTLLGISGSQAQTAEGILKKADAIYSKAKTYQSSYRWERTVHSSNGTFGYVDNQTVTVRCRGTKKFAMHALYDAPKNLSPTKSGLMRWISSMTVRKTTSIFRMMLLIQSGRTT